MDDWSSWCITHHPIQRLKIWQFSSIHAGPSLEYCVASIDMTPLLCCLCICVSTWPMHPQTDWEGCQDLSGWWSTWYIIHHPRQEQEVRQFYFIHAGPSLECCVASMDKIPLLGCLYNCVSTSPMYPLMNWEGCQCLHWWLELMVHHTPSQAGARSVPKFSSIHPWSILGVLCNQYGYDALALVACTMVDQPHPWIYWWIERGVNTCMNGWSSW
jgi:hypothetical protein